VTGDVLRSPLSHAAGRLEGVATRSASRVSAREERGLAQVSVRLKVGDAGRSTVALPTEPNTVRIDDDAEALWLGPDEWLVVSERPAAEVVGQLEAALEGSDRSIVDVSGGRAVIDLSGHGRLDALASGCPIDLHPRSWRTERCAQTLFGRAQVLLQERRDETRLFVRPSFADYVVELLAEAAAAPRRS
jgi:sarcosine oxidase subunit gamma